MDAFETLGDPVRRLIVEELTGGERSAGELTVSAQDRFGISQPAVSQHLRVLRERGFVTTRAEGTRRYYRLAADPFADLRRWLSRYDRFWSGALDDLGTYLDASCPQGRYDREQDHD